MNKSSGFFKKRQKVEGRLLQRWVGAALVCLAVAGCGSDVQVSFNLINPCRTDVLGDEECQYIRLVVSSLSARDPLHPDNEGPLARICEIGAGSCTVSNSELLGPGRIVDIQCLMDNQGSPPVARATSQSLLLDSGGGGKFNLLLGNIDGFVETTYLKGDNIGDCSTLAQDGGRYGHTATLLDDGRVLIVGGIRRLTNTVEEILATAEIFDPVTGIHRLVVVDGKTTSLNSISGRAYHTATKLRDGRVLITGGVGVVTGKWTSLKHSEIFDPDTETFPPGWVRETQQGRAHHTATLLTSSGKVLAVGGAIYNGPEIVAYHDTAEVYDPGSGAWVSAITNMSAPRAHHTATELDPNTDQGKVLVTGGSGATGPLKTVEIYDPGANQFYPNVGVAMVKNRAHHCAVRLNDGRVLVAGGTTTGQAADVDAGVEIYSSGLGSYGGFENQTLNFNAARMDHTCTLLEGIDDVLVVGGLTGTAQATGQGEVVEMVNGIPQMKLLTDPVDPPRYRHAAAALGNGWVHVSGGLASEAPDAQAIIQSLLFVPETPYQ